MCITVVKPHSVRFGVMRVYQKWVQDMTPSVIPFQKAHDLYISADFRKIEKFDIFINKIFRFVKKIGLKVPYFATRVPKLCERYSQV